MFNFNKQSTWKLKRLTLWYTNAFLRNKHSFHGSGKKTFFFIYFHILYLYIFVKVVTNMLHVSKYHVEKTPKRTRQNCISALQVHLGGTGPSSQKNIWIQMKKKHPNTVMKIQLYIQKYKYKYPNSFLCYKHSFRSFVTSQVKVSFPPRKLNSIVSSQSFC